MLVGWLIVVECLVMFFSSNDDTSADTPAQRHPISQILLLAQQLNTLGPSLGQAV